MTNHDRTLEINGLKTHFHEAGEGPDLLLLHGSGPGVSAWANWQGVFDRFAENFHVVAPDLLGFGDTDTAPNNEYSMKAWLDHLIGLMDVLDIERAHVVGNSFGGALAMRLTLDHPDRVKRLVTMGSVGVPGEIPPGLEQVWGFEPSFEAMRDMLDLFAYNRDLISDDLARMRLESVTQPGVHEAFAAMFPPPRQKMFDEMSISLDELSTIDKTTLIIHGRDDQVIPMEISVTLVNTISDSQLHVFGQTGHWVQIEQNVRFGNLVTDFLLEDEADEI